ncbi:MAG: hypothetical protein Fur0014_05160 [Rubrivivax sp.]
MVTIRPRSTETGGTRGLERRPGPEVCRPASAASAGPAGPCAGRLAALAGGRPGLRHRQRDAAHRGPLAAGRRDRGRRQWTALDVREIDDLQILTGPDPVKACTKGSGLGRFLQALPPEQAAAFEADDAARVRAAYPPLADGRTVFPYRRLFILAVR